MKVNSKSLQSSFLILKGYLFKTDEKWIEAVKAPFTPWKDNVIIVNKNVSSKNNDRNITLDQFFKDKEQFVFLKIDAEGGEAEILNGCEALLSSNQQLKIALCCCHRPNDEFLFNELLEKKGFSVSFTKGYMIFYEPEIFLPTYLRKGIKIFAPHIFHFFINVTKSHTIVTAKRLRAKPMAFEPVIISFLHLYDNIVFFHL